MCAHARTVAMVPYIILDTPAAVTVITVIRKHEHKLYGASMAGI